MAGRHVIIWPDNDEPGAKYALEVATILTGLGCEVAAIDAAALVAIDGGARGPNCEPIGWDAADAIAEWADTVALRNAAVRLAKPFTEIEFAAAEAKPAPDEAAIERRVVDLSGLTELKYELARASAAKKLGISVSFLDKLVKRGRWPPGESAGGVVFADVAPWDADIDSAALLDEICGTIRRFVVCESEVPVAVALWIAFTWLIDRVEIAPLSLLDRSMTG